MLMWIHKQFSFLVSYCLPKYLKRLLVKNYELVIKVPYIYLYPLMGFLKSNIFCRFKVLTDIICCDVLKKNRFVVIYHLLNINLNVRVRVYCELLEISSLYSATSIFKNANWLEREVWDMFGVFFEKHPDLKRILTDYNFSWHPLRKDFPLTGYNEVLYVDTLRELTFINTAFSQRYKEFVYNSLWN